MKFGEYVQLKHHPKGFLLWKRCFFFNCFLFVLKASCVFRCYSSTTPNAIRIRFWLAVHESHVSYDFQSIPFEGIVYVATHITHCTFVIFSLSNSTSFGLRLIQSKSATFLSEVFSPFLCN